MKSALKTVLFAGITLAACSSQAQLLSQKIISSTTHQQVTGPLGVTLYAQSSGTAAVGYAQMIGSYGPPITETTSGWIYQTATYEVYWQTASGGSPPTDVYLHLDGNAQASAALDPVSGGAVGAVDSDVNGQPSTLTLSWSCTCQPVRGHEITFSGSPAASAKIEIAMTWTKISGAGADTTVYQSQEITVTTPAAFNEVAAPNPTETVAYNVWGAYSVAIQFLGS